MGRIRLPAVMDDDASTAAARERGLSWFEDEVTNAAAVLMAQFNAQREAS